MKALDVNCLFYCALKGDTVAALKHGRRIISELKASGEGSLAKVLESTLTNHLALGSHTVMDGPRFPTLAPNNPIKDPKLAATSHE